ncbi:LacI family DNA-binding transcriptional regulator [Vibrio mytili]|uniref:LacI family DNA-binding transcriptional regulator n=1 Tax=Vibrio TaxID=662 RepID=UPI001B8213DE|nr:MULTISPECIES: LacI family transcriptional regulator [unclassified Vibrio]EJE4203754.1 LacI family DNA-binding transcriptional regulator [Vibrio parahaemolyticus]MCR9981283.1 LacI family transcriptional regulator [Vibrio alginolyticus]MEA3484301.1 LacI family DNA-binding transcriptional regulator [Pseudomonadota bacterium]HDM8244088.1 LacI family DNA-binding transcriptional regulator [Vibrio campbellii]ELB2264083.1 LacI family DNA-binding transcriptional regulator [Vibrio parahaemolyticus]
MATIKHVSEHAGVSQATVSRVINGTSRVSHDKKLKVEKAIKELGYRPNSIAQALASSRTGSVGIVVPELGGPFYSGILHCLEEHLRRFGYYAVVTAGSNNAKEQREAVEFLLGRKVDALILHVQNLSDDYLISLEEQGIPVVLLNRFIPEMSRSCIDIDNEFGGKLATQYLLKMGHTEIACITGPLDKSDARGRLQGYRKALEEAGLEYNEVLVSEAGFTEETGVSATKKLLKRDCRFSAIFASNDHMAFGAFEVLREEGYSIPDDVSLVGFDDNIFARYLTPSLTTINFPIEQMSIEAVQLTLQKLTKNKQDVNFKLSPALVIRNSVKDITSTL